MNIESVCIFMESLNDRNTALSFMTWLESEMDNDRCWFNDPELDLLAESVEKLRNKLTKG